MANSSALKEFREKEADTMKRLGKVFAVMVKVPTGAYFVVGGTEAPFLFSNDNFKCVCIGHSSVDVSEGEDLLREIGSRIASTYSEADLHALVVATFASRCMQLDLENLKNPRGVAAEFIILDIDQKVIKVRFNGDVEVEELEDMESNFVLIGAYDPAFRKTLMAEVKKLPTDFNRNNYKKKSEILGKVALAIKSKLGLKHVGILQ